MPKAWEERLADRWETWDEDERRAYHERYTTLLGVFRGGDLGSAWALAHAGYPSVAALRQATDAELLAVPGIGRARLTGIRRVAPRASMEPLPAWVSEE